MFFHMVYKSGQFFLPFCLNSRVWQTDGRTDKQIDGRTVGQTELSSLDRVCIPCSAVKISNKTVYLSVFNAFCVVDFPDMLLAGGSDLTHEVEMLRDGVRSVGDDVMLQHWEHLHRERPSVEQCYDRLARARAIDEKLDDPSPRTFDF